MEKIKVLQLHPDFNIRPLDIADLGEQIFKALPKESYETTNGFLTGKPKPGDKESVADRSIYFQFKSKQLKGLRLKAMWQLYQHIKQGQYDVVICNRFKPVIMLLFISRFLSIPLCIGVAHGFGDYDRSYRRKQVKRWVRDNWRFVGVSPAVKQHLLDLNSGFTENNTVAITNAIDVEQAVAIQLSKEDARTRLGLPLKQRLIGALGRLVPVKGHTYLIAAFAEIADDFPDTDLVLVGEGREREHLEQQIQTLGLSERVHLTGFVENALAYVQAFDIWTMPSLAEGLGLALLEGMTGSLPIIASDVPAMRPLIEGAGGIAVPPAKVPELKQALVSYLSLSEDELQKLGEQAYRYVLQHHSLLDFQQAYRQLIETNLPNC